MLGPGSRRAVAAPADAVVPGGADALRREPRAQLRDLQGDEPGALHLRQVVRAANVAGYGARGALGPSTVAVANARPDDLKALKFVFSRGLLAPVPRVQFIKGRRKREKV